MTDLLEIIAKVFLPTVAFVCIAIGVPMLGYNTIRMTLHKRTQPRSWHDLWGFNRNNLIFFPSKLTEEGQRIRQLALRGARIVTIGVLAMVIASLMVR